MEINVTNNRHFVFVYLLGKLDYSLYSQRNDNRLYIVCNIYFTVEFIQKEKNENRQKHSQAYNSMVW